MDLPFNQLSLGQEWIAQAKLIWCPAPLPKTTQDPMLTKMLEVAPSEEGEEGHREHTTYATEVFSKGGIESPSFQGEKRTASNKIRSLRPQSEGRNLHQRVLRQGKTRPHYLP